MRKALEGLRDTRHPSLSLPERGDQKKEAGEEREDNSCRIKAGSGGGRKCKKAEQGQEGASH